MSSSGSSGSGGKLNLVSPDLELSDPNPDIFALFVYFNDLFFQGELGGVTVQWSPRMTLCAGICRFKGPIGGCSVHLSKPLLSLRPRRDLIETLLHEMIHAFLFVTDKNREREDHGPKFLSHMNRINQRAGTNISVYHSFHDEVAHFKTHWWKCDGPCQHRPPYFGVVKRSMNRAPGPNDNWWSDHKRTCGGTYTKIKEPSPKKKVSKRKNDEVENIASGSKKITQFFSKDDKTEIVPKDKSQVPKDKSVVPKDESLVPMDKPIVFTGSGHRLGGGSSNNQVKNPPAKKICSAAGGRSEHPLLAKWNANKLKTQTPSASGNSNLNIPQVFKIEKNKSRDPSEIDVIVID